MLKCYRCILLLADGVEHVANLKEDQKVVCEVKKAAEVLVGCAMTLLKKSGKFGGKEVAGSCGGWLLA